MLANIFWYVIIPAALFWLAYSIGWQRGFNQGFYEGKDEGVKEGKALGERIGIEKGIKDRVLNSIKGSGGSVLDQTEMQIREKFYADLTKKPAPPPSAPESTSYVGYWWAAASLAGVLLIFWLV
ncbi:MAG: hypothetical protein E6Q85_05310 [Thiothrix sp.]|nr:MAG: hypothetical protein E6Q85_05310 [Thiothrix sp.]